MLHFVNLDSPFSRHSPEWKWMLKVEGILGCIPNSKEDSQSFSDIQHTFVISRPEDENEHILKWEGFRARIRESLNFHMRGTSTSATWVLKLELTPSTKSVEHVRGNTSSLDENQ